MDPYCSKWFWHVPRCISRNMEPPPVRAEEPERDARRYELLRAYLLLTGLMGRVDVKMLPTDSGAQRYRLLRDHVLSGGIIRHMKLPVGENVPFVVGKELYGETVEEAVDALESWNL